MSRRSYGLFGLARGSGITPKTIAGKAGSHKGDPTGLIELLRF